MTHHAIVSGGARLALGFLAIWSSLATTAAAQDRGPAPAGRVETPEQAVLRAIDETWPDHPEWLDELTDILQDSGLGPSDGWHRRAVAQTRFAWNSVAKKLDRDGDDHIGRKEFPGSDLDFARLDRDRDGSLTPVDFDFSAHALAASPGSLMMYVMDGDGNGKLGREEFEAFFKKADSGDLGCLSLSDLQENFRAQARPPVHPNRGGPSKEILIRALFSQEIGSLQPGPALGETAPDFTLTTNEGKGEVTLSKLTGPKPVVLVFGNFTCGPFRNQAGNVEKLYRLYKDRAEFVMVYVREAHPTDGWRMDGNDQVGIATAQPRTYEERASLARTCGARLGLGFPMVVDAIDDKVGGQYSGMPSRLYLIDRTGKVAYKSGRGPYGFKPAELEQSLVLLLQEEAGEAGGRGGARAVAPGLDARGAIAMLSNEDAWKRLPAADAGGGQTLPNWARATARSLPRTTAAMLELDRLHRTKSPLGASLRGKMRWVAADANRCEYSRATAEADLRRGGMKDDEIAALKGGPDRWPEGEKAALAFADQMSREASEVTDEQVDAIRRSYGEEKLVSMVLLLASANFQDRFLLSLGTPVEDGGPLAPVEARFARDADAPPAPDRVPVAEYRGPAVPDRVDDPEWGALEFEVIRKGLNNQKANVGRIRVPTSEEAVRGLPADYPRPKSPMRIKWSLVCFGYQPELAAAWSSCMKPFEAEAKLDEVFVESLFWVVTRTIHCFY